MHKPCLIFLSALFRLFPFSIFLIFYNFLNFHPIWIKMMEVSKVKSVNIFLLGLCFCLVRSGLNTMLQTQVILNRSEGGRMEGLVRTEASPQQTPGLRWQISGYNLGNHNSLKRNKLFSNVIHWYLPLVLYRRRALMTADIVLSDFGVIRQLVYFLPNHCDF